MVGSARLCFTSNLQTTFQLLGIGLVGANRLAALARTAPDIALPADLGAIHTVGDMMRLAQACEADRALDDGVRMVLSLSRSVWVKAKRAALAAVEPDCRCAFVCWVGAGGLMFADCACGLCVRTGARLFACRLRGG